MDPAPRHQCLIYEGSPARHLLDLAGLIAQKLKENRRCLFLNTPAMVAGVRSYLAAAGVDVSEEVRKRALVLSSDRSHLIDNGFDAEKMLGMLGESVNQALKDGYASLWATGDMTWELGSKENFPKLLEHERGLERLFHRLPALGGICQYRRDTLPMNILEVALYTHPAVYINRTLTRINPYYRAPESVTHPRKGSNAEVSEMLNRIHQSVEL